VSIPEKILFVGLGGAGQRHLRIFRDILPHQTEYLAYRRTSGTPLLRPDFTVDDSSTIESAYGVRMYASLHEAFAEAPDLAVISTPTACHREPMMMAAEAGCGVFVEKPWAEDLRDFSCFREIISTHKLPFHISFQRRYHPLIMRARQLLISGRIGKPIIANFTVFTDVRVWHPYEDWRNLYAVQSGLGGGVLLTEIHEIDLCYWFFGLPKAVFCSGGNYSGEVLDVEDTVQLTLIYSDFTVGITLCFLHNKNTRSIHIVGSKGDIVWDGTDNRLVVSSKNLDDEVVSNASYRNDEMFEAQARKYLSNWTTTDTEESLNSAAASLAIVDAARKSMQSNSMVNVDPCELSY